MIGDLKYCQFRFQTVALETNFPTVLESPKSELRFESYGRKIDSINLLNQTNGNSYGCDSHSMDVIRTQVWILLHFLRKR